MSVSLYLMIYFSVTGLLMIAGQQVAERSSMPVFLGIYGGAGWIFAVLAATISFISVARKTFLAVEVKQITSGKYLCFALLFSVLSSASWFVFWLGGAIYKPLLFASLFLLLIGFDPLFFGVRKAKKETYAEAINRSRAEATGPKDEEEA